MSKLREREERQLTTLHLVLEEEHNHMMYTQIQTTETEIKK